MKKFGLKIGYYTVRRQVLCTPMFVIKSKSVEAISVNHKKSGES